MKRIFLSAALALLATSAFAQVKISELPPATTPLDGSELVPIVQGSTVQATTQDIADLAAAPAGAALTRTNDTNVTLTLGGTPTTALLQATSITAGWTGTLAVARGGTGASSLAAAGIPTTTNNVAFTPGCTGYAACPITSNSAHYSITGNIACLGIQNFGGTSNATNFTITGLPSAINPVNNGLQGPSGVIIATNNATRGFATFTIAGDGSGVISFRNGTTAGTTTWTASGSKGLAEDFNYCYPIN